MCLLTRKMHMFWLKKVNAALTKLPNYIYQRFGKRPLCETAPSETHALFGEILDFYKSNGIRYQLKNSL